MPIEFLILSLITITICSFFTLIVWGMNYFSTLADEMRIEIKRLMAVYHHAFVATDDKALEEILEKAWREMPEAIQKEIQ